MNPANRENSLNFESMDSNADNKKTAKMKIIPRLRNEKYLCQIKYSNLPDSVLSFSSMEVKMQHNTN